MGSVTYRKIQHVLEIPSDILVKCIGDGLTVSRLSDSEKLQFPEQSPCSLNVNTGDGLGFDSDGKLCANIAKSGDGLTLDKNRVIAVSIDNESALIINDGKLSIDKSKINMANLEVDENSGLKVNDGKLSIDTESAVCDTITNITNVCLRIDGKKLILTKTFTDYNIKRNNVGLVVDIEVGEIHKCEDEVVLDCCNDDSYDGGYGCPDGYGHGHHGYGHGHHGYGCPDGYGKKQTNPVRMSLPFQPNFYQK